MCGIVTGGWLLARSAQAAARALSAGGGDADFLRQKLVTARFYAEQLLPQAAGLAPAVMAGPADLDEAAF
jgi:3-(methylthio)propanoyl-CoA dehydrogenase